MASGVTVNDKCCEIFQEVKIRSKNVKKRLFAVYKISDDLKEIVPDLEFDPEEKITNLDELLTTLPAGDGRYVIFDYKYKSQSGAANSKLILISWVPEGTTIKKKMLYASSKNSLKNMVHEDIPLFMLDRIEDLCEKDIVSKLTK